MGLTPRRKSRRQAVVHRRPLQKRLIASDPATPRTWGEWKATTGRRWWCYPLAVEWALEWFVYRLRRLALFDLLELAGKFTVLVAIIFWFLEADQRARQAEEAIKARHYRAWELINAARGSTGDGGRKDALQDLNKDGVSLAKAPLEKAYLQKVDLKDADLVHANLQDANLFGANLQGAILWKANLQGANLIHANLQDARLMHANLQGARLMLGADLRGASDLTQEQLNAADGDYRTVLPDGFTRPAHWEKAEASDVPPAHNRMPLETPLQRPVRPSRTSKSGAVARVQQGRYIATVK